MRDSLRDSLLSHTRPQRRLLPSSSNANDSAQQERGYLRSLVAFVVLMWSAVVVAVTNAARNVTTRRPKSMRVSAKNEDVADLESGSTIVASTTEPSSDRPSKDSRLMSLDFFCQSGSFRAASSMSARKESEAKAKGKCDSTVEAPKSLVVATKMKTAADADAREERHLTTTEMMDSLQDEIELLAIMSKYTMTASEPDTSMLSDKGGTPILGDIEEVEIRLHPSLVGHHGGFEQQQISDPLRKTSGVSQPQEMSSVVGDENVDVASAFSIPIVDNHSEVKQQPAAVPMYRGDLHQKETVTSAQDIPIMTRGEDVGAISAFPLLSSDSRKSDIRTSLSFADKQGNVASEPVDVTMQHEQQKTVATQESPFVARGEKADACLVFPRFSVGKEEARIRSSASSSVRESESAMALEPAKASMQREQKQPKVTVAKQVVPFPVRDEDEDPSLSNPISDGPEKAQIQSNVLMAGRHGGVVRELANFLMQRQQKKKQNLLTQKEAEFATRSKGVDEASTIPILGGGDVEEVKIQSTPLFVGRRGDIEPTSIPILELTTASTRHEQQQPMSVKKQDFSVAVQRKKLDAASTIPILGDGEKTQVRSFTGRFGGAVRELANAVMQREQKQSQKVALVKQEALLVSQGGNVGAALTIPITDGDIVEVNARSSSSLMGHRDGIVQEPASVPIQHDQKEKQHQKVVNEVQYLPRGEDMDATLGFPILGAGEQVEIRSSPLLGSYDDVGRKPADVPMLESSAMAVQYKDAKEQKSSFTAQDEDVDEISTFAISGDEEKPLIQSAPLAVGRRGGIVRELVSLFSQRRQIKRQDLPAKQEVPSVAPSSASMLSAVGDASEVDARSNASFAGKRGGAEQETANVQMERKQLKQPSQKTIASKQGTPSVACGEEVDTAPALSVFSGDVEEKQLKSRSLFTGRRGGDAQALISNSMLKPAGVPIQREELPKIVKRQEIPFVVRDEDENEVSMSPKRKMARSSSSFAGDHDSTMRKLSSVVTQRKQKQHKSLVVGQGSPFVVRDSVDTVSMVPVLDDTMDETEFRSSGSIQRQQEQSYEKTVVNGPRHSFAMRVEDEDETSTFPILEEAHIRSSQSFFGHDDIAVREPANSLVLKRDSAPMRREQEQDEETAVPELGISFPVWDEEVDAVLNIPILSGEEKAQSGSSVWFPGARGGVVSELANALKQREHSKQNTSASKQRAPFMAEGENIGAPPAVSISDSGEGVTVRPSASFVGKLDAFVQEPTDVSARSEELQPNAVLTKQQSPFGIQGEDVDVASTISIVGSVVEAAIQPSPSFMVRGGGITRELAAVFVQREQKQQQNNVVKMQEAPLLIAKETSPSPILYGGNESMARSSPPSMSHRDSFVQDATSVPMLLANVQMQREQQKAKAVMKTQTAPLFMSGGEDLDAASPFPILDDEEEVKIRPSPSCRSIVNEPTSVPVLNADADADAVAKALKKEDTVSMIQREGTDAAMILPSLGGAEEVGIQSTADASHHGDIVREIIDAPTQCEKPQTMTVTTQDVQLAVGDEDTNVATTRSSLGDEERSQIRLSASLTGRGGVVRGLANALMQRQRQNFVEKQETSLVTRGVEVGAASEISTPGGSAEEGEAAKVRMSSSFVDNFHDVAQEPVNVPAMEPRDVPAQPKQGHGQGKIALPDQEFSFLESGEDIGVALTFPIPDGTVDEAEIQSLFAGKLHDIVQKPARIPMFESVSSSTRCEEQQPKTVAAKGKDSTATRREYAATTLLFSILDDAEKVKATSRPSYAAHVVQEPASDSIMGSSGALMQLDQNQRQKSADMRQRLSFVARSEAADVAPTLPIPSGAANKIDVPSTPLLAERDHDAVPKSFSAPMLEAHAFLVQREKQPHVLEKQGIPFVARGEKLDKEPELPFLVAEADTLETQSKPSFAGRCENSVHQQVNSSTQHGDQKTVKKQEAPFVAREEGANATSMHSTLSGVPPFNAPMLEPTGAALQREQQKKAMTQEVAIMTKVGDEEDVLTAFDSTQPVDACNKIDDDGDEEMKPLSPMQNYDVEDRVSAELQDHELAERRGTLQSSSSDEEMKPAALVQTGDEDTKHDAPMQTGEASDGGEDMKPAVSMQNVEVKPRKFTIEDRAKIKEALDLFELKQMQEAAEIEDEAEMDVAVCCPVQ